MQGRGKREGKMKTYYSSEKNVQLLVGLLKAHKIRKIVVSPGTTNICLIASIQQDIFFEIYSSVDERSAAYMACGLAAESGEPVALSCTGATASRNYVPGLTEAFYRKLPVLAITSTQPIGRVGQNIAQVIDRSNPMKDICKISVHIPTIHDKEDMWACEVMINNALLELRRRGGGPAHINLTTNYSIDFSIKELPVVRVINRISYGESLPEIAGKKIAIFVGAHLAWSERLTEAVDCFCEKYNAVVLCDQGSNYKGKYGVFFNMMAFQAHYVPKCVNMDITIHIGDVTASNLHNPKQVWRVNPDGEIRDTFRSLRYVFEMEEVLFFESYIKMAGEGRKKTQYYEEWKCEYDSFLDKLKVAELPFSNIWIAQHTYELLPKKCIIHFGILTSLRSWNFFEPRKDILGYANTGGFGIDGCISSLIGASLSNEDKLYFGIVGDLAFFYDMNSIGNRHVGKNLRIMVVNNGIGSEFKNKLNLAIRAGLEETADEFIAAAGHYGNKSRKLIKHYAEDLGFQYISASNKEEYLKNVELFVQTEMGGGSILFEVFTNSEDETEALDIVRNLKASAEGMVRKAAKNIIGDKGVRTIKRLLQ